MMDEEFLLEYIKSREYLLLRWYLPYFMPAESSAVEDIRYPEDFTVLVHQL